MVNLEGHVALVSGASRGIGRAIAVRLSDDGARVAVNYNSSVSEAQQVVAEITAKGGEAIALRGDVSNADQVKILVQHILNKWERIDILINNAGIRKDRLLLRMTPEEWDTIINVNLRSAYLCIKEVLPHMVRQKRGRIINMSSVVGLSGNPGQANYSASKAGLIGLTKTVAREVATRNITANALAPGYIITNMVDELSDTLKSRVLSNIPMGRFGSPDDVSGLAAFLCSDEASYITGQVIKIDGGLAT